MPRTVEELHRSARVTLGGSDVRYLPKRYMMFCGTYTKRLVYFALRLCILILNVKPNCNPVEVALEMIWQMQFI